MFAAYVSSVRRQRGVTLREVARQTGVPHITVSRFFAGTPVRLESAVILLAWLGVDPGLRSAVLLVPVQIDGQLALTFDGEG